MRRPPPSAFSQLRELLRPITAPTGLDPIHLHLGESRLAAPVLDARPLADAARWSRYPQLGGSPQLRAAYSDWLVRRFGVPPDLIAGSIEVEPTPGTKQAAAVTIGLAVARAGRATEPAVIMPNPYYPTYRAGAVAVGARPVFYTPGQDTAAAVRSAVEGVAGHVAAVIVCNPGNPRGEVLSADALRDVALVARRVGALLLVDECYTDLSAEPLPPGFLAVVAQAPDAVGRFLVLHSLSKRSSAPGLRSGFAVGDPETVAAYADYNRQCGVSTPDPVCAVAVGLWSDEAHVRQARQALCRNWELADSVLGAVAGYRRPQAGFFLWLPVPDDEEVTRRLWRDHGLLVMPGRYLGAAGADGVNPGAGHLRVALAQNEPQMRQALSRLRDAVA